MKWTPPLWAAAGVFSLPRAFFLPDKESVAQLQHQGGVYRFRFIVPENYKADSTYFSKAKELLRALKTEVFPDDTMEVVLCDAYFRSLQILTLHQDHAGAAP